MNGQRRRGEEEEEEEVRRSKKQGKKEKLKKGRELKNIATGCWVTLESDGGDGADDGADDGAGDGADDGEMKHTWNCLSCRVPLFSPPSPDKKANHPINLKKTLKSQSILTYN